MKKSTQTVICEIILKVASGKGWFSNEQKAINMLKVKSKKNLEAYKPPLSVNFYAKKRKKDKMDYYKIEGKSDKVVMYIHGGAFINRPLIFHWKFIKDLNKATNATVYFPIYPLAPNYHYKETYSKLLSLYKHILKKTDAKNITIIGESAGGTLTVGLSLLLRDSGIAQPNHIIPLSACYDLTFSNPEIEKLNEVDLMLHSIGCRVACGSWAGENNLKNPLVSPLYANLKGLTKINVIVGTDEIMLPDTRLFVEKAKKEGLDITYLEKNGMGHAYPLYPTPEAKEAKKIIYNIVVGD